MRKLPRLPRLYVNRPDDTQIFYRGLKFVRSPLAHRRNLPGRRAANQQGGFTLIEIAIAMTLAGLALAAFLGMKRVELVQHKIDVTRNNVDRVQTALAAYKSIHGHYPCPARLDAGQGSEDFGRSSVCDNAVNPVATGDCASGHCVRAGRLVDHDGNPSTPLQALRVRVGTVPAADLGIRPDQMKDAYGNMLVYAVTEAMAIDKATYATVDDGGIDVVDGNGDSLLETAGTAQFVTLSTGRDGIGAITYGTGMIALPCGVTSAQSPNCNHFSPNMPATFALLPWSTAGGVPQFDDVVAWDLPVAGAPAAAPTGSSVSMTPLTLMGETTCPGGFREVYQGSRIVYKSPAADSGDQPHAEDMCVATPNLRVCGSPHMAMPCTSAGGKAMSTGQNATISMLYWKHTDQCVVCVPETVGG